MDSDKVEAVTTWPLPRSARGLCGFLDLAGYYRRFIKNFGAIAAPLMLLLKRDGFRWTEEATTVFIVDCDASGSGFGAVLHQGEGPLAFFSWPFMAWHMKVTAYERELIGLV
ncbi:uncharacterized mitochondrial protein AtMg00860-like [Miscanthus floridulus]|uniref:uncharacterized mitochondrial protein AtMg00860-like n=1 Tax=Miscanthus floridulus TaxID=154761 RepID=UPI0034583CBE